MALSIFLTGLGFGLVGFAAHVPELTAIVVLLTFAEMMHAPIVQAVVSDLAPTPLRGRYMGAQSMSFALALMVGAPLGGWTLEHLGGEVLWPMSFVMGVVSALLLLSIRRHLVVGAGRLSMSSDSP
jgi:MFS family permease